ncbi:MAG: demethylmenaquinone methyltransferase [Negativicutes bacterium]|nr:demethylmenaquinone methyltransferase [Negativicutes bacterium]
MLHATNKDKEQFVHQVFSAIAHRYDRLNTLLSFNRDKYWRAKTVEITKITAGANVLDVCCGTGMLTLELAKAAGPSGHVTGLDFCQNMLDQAVVNIAKTPYRQNITLIQGNAMNLPFDDNCFDCATIAFALRNVPNILQVICEMQRVVKPGGRVVSLELAKPSMPGFKQLYYFYFEQLLPWLGRAGVGIDGPYRWLPESLRCYPHQEKIKEIFADAGLAHVEYIELTGGIVAIHFGIKQEAPCAN